MSRSVKKPQVPGSPEQGRAARIREQIRELISSERNQLCVAQVRAMTTCNLTIEDLQLALQHLMDDGEIVVESNPADPLALVRFVGKRRK